MIARVLTTILAIAIPAVVSAQAPSRPGEPLPGCTDTSNCPLIDFTQRALGAGLEGVTLAPGGAAGLLLARTQESALPAFRLIWIDQTPPLSPDRTATEFMRGLTRPDRFCNHRPIAMGASPDGKRGAFDLRCDGGQVQAVQVVLYAVQDEQRTRTLVLLAPLNNGPALLARGQRVIQGAVQAAAVPQRSYAQLREDCADDGDAQRQIAGCNAVLVHPDEANNYAIAVNNRGHAQERSGNLRAALEDYDRAIAREPGYSVAHVNRGRVLSQLERFADAHSALDRALAIDNNIWARLERARVFLRQRDGDRALAELDRTMQAEPRFAEALVERARLRAERNDHRRAAEDFEAALAVEPDNRAAAEGRDKARAQLAASAPVQSGQPNLRQLAQGSAPSTPSHAPSTGIETVRGLMRDKPFTVSYPAEFNQTADAGSELFLDHPGALFQVSLKVAPSAPGASAQSAARSPAAQVATADRSAFRDFSLEQRSLVVLPAGPVHLYVATMTSPMGNRPRLRMVVAEYFGEGRRYELAFTVSEEAFSSAGTSIGFILANFSPNSAPRACCAAPITLPW
ncbi:tetratricopeptide repeat protein [Phreatobacter aquaticus]|uniref:Tetratricopeptide repeat protein n=1 Tax=Phreatobacter aquaticus TaxID=2570229 RepID=A0A4D7QTG1_9HYPH|nr:tetratricopeptide repeat protein [Phreatobacter aquaticus]QCK88504.1 tetratricopeptide repeat protein [Phreatobacter aquaticus]